MTKVIYCLSYSLKLFMQGTFFLIIRYDCKYTFLTNKSKEEKLTELGSYKKDENWYGKFVALSTVSLNVASLFQNSDEVTGTISPNSQTEEGLNKFCNYFTNFLNSTLNHENLREVLSLDDICIEVCSVA